MKDTSVDGAPERLVVPEAEPQGQQHRGDHLEHQAHLHHPDEHATDIAETECL